MIYSTLEWICTLVALGAFLYRILGPFTNKTEPAAIALSIYFLSSFLSFAVGLDTISPYIAKLFNFQNITIILSHAAVIVLTTAQQVVLIYWTHPPELARRRALKRIIVFGVVLAFLIASFLLILPRRRRDTSETSSLLNLHNPYYATYLGFFIIAVAVGQIATLRGSLRYAKLTHRLWLRQRMLTLALGAVLILVYCIVRFIQTVAGPAGGDMTPWNPIQWVAGDVGSLLELLGWTAPAWGPRLSTWYQWVRKIHYYHSLRPLWVALYEATPEILLHPPLSPLVDFVWPGDIDYRLYRRLIEILDGQLALRPYFDPTVAEAAVRQVKNSDVVTDDQRSATILAIQIHAALWAKTDDVERSGGTSKMDDLTENLTDEAKKLVMVADAFVSSIAAARTIFEATNGHRPNL
ncbi:MAG: MAB_1171c family putative transporter [Pseudonocardiaceae bacterium]